MGLVMKPRTTGATSRAAFELEYIAIATYFTCMFHVFIYNLLIGNFYAIFHEISTHNYLLQDDV